MSETDETASQKVTDEELARAAEEVEPTETEGVKVEEETKETGDEVKETKEEVTSIPPEPTDNRERSALGRKTAYLEERIESFDSKLDEVLAAIELGKKPDISEDEESFLTKKDLKAWMEKQETNKLTVKSEYDKQYIRAISKLGADEEVDEVFDAILTELNSTYNQTYSQDASNDALINYLKASRAVYSKKPTRQNPLEKNKDKGGNGLGVSGGTKVKSKEAPLPELDSYAKDFIKETGMSESDVREALSSESKVHKSGDTVIGSIKNG